MEDRQVLVGEMPTKSPIPSSKTMETIMRHPDDFKAWADNHDALSSDIHKLLKGLMQSFKVLVAREYDAPWQRRDAKCD
jgi:hypothetical protein